MSKPAVRILGDLSVFVPRELRIDNLNDQRTIENLVRLGLLADYGGRGPYGRYVP